jgi:uncharacterized repeat protein (TIGR01451 family)
VSGAPPNQSLVYAPTTLAGTTTTKAHVVSNTTSGSCGVYANTASFTTSNDGSGSASASTTVNCATVAISKTADAASVSAGSQIGFTVTLANSTAGTATGLSVTDSLPAGTGVNWTIDAGNTSAGWSVSGAPPNQSLVYAPTTLAGTTTTKAHVVSNTTSGSCGAYANTASFTTSNDGSGSASASTTVNCATVTISKTADAASVSAGSQIGFTVTLANSTAGTAMGLSVTDSLPAGTGVNWTIDAGNTSAGWSVSGSPPNQSLVYAPTTLAGTTMTKAHVVSNTTTGSCGPYNNTASFSTSNDGSGSASASTTVNCAQGVAQITPGNTTCAQFASGTAQALSSLQYALKGNVINEVNPGVFNYWVKVTAQAGSNTFVINELITTGNSSTLFRIGNGNNNPVFDSTCNGGLKPSITQNSSGSTMVTWTAPTAGVYYISVKFDATSIDSAAAPSPITTVHYNYSTNGVVGSNAGIDLVKK